MEESLARKASKSLFITRKGTVGLGPQTVRVGDVVFLLLGGRVPYVLRHTKKASETPERNIGPEYTVYELIGECYVPDLMHGEGLVWARARKNPELMRHKLRTGYEENNWLNSLDTGPFPFEIEEVILC